MTGAQTKDLPLEELLRAAASALRWCQGELEGVNLESKYFTTIAHPMRKQLVALADRLDEVAKAAPSR